MENLSLTSIHVSAEIPELRRKGYTYVSLDGGVGNEVNILAIWTTELAPLKNKYMESLMIHLKRYMKDGTAHDNL